MNFHNFMLSANHYLGDNNTLKSSLHTVYPLPRFLPSRYYRKRIFEVLLRNDDDPFKSRDVRTAE